MTPNLRGFSKNSKIVAIAGILCFGSLGLFGWVHSIRKDPPIPVFQVQRAEFLDALQFRGELKALKSVTVAAPPDIGSLQIVKIVSDGAQVKQGDMVVEFDASKTKQDLDQDRSVVKSADAQIEQARAEGKLTEEEDTTALMKGRYDVESAKLDASKSEIVSKIDGAEAELKVKDAEQTLRQAEEKLKSDKAKNKATIDGYRNASAKARFDEERAERALNSMEVKAPSAGTVSLVSVWHDGSEGTFKAGERVWSGAPIAELPDASSLRIAAHVDETERGRLAVAQAVTLQLDAINDRQFTGKIEQIGTIATMDFSAGWPFPRNFNLDIGIDQKEPRFRPGMTAQITVIVDRIPNSISIPVQASFMKSGHTVVYVWDGSKFKERAMQIERRSRDRALISSGLDAGDRIALQDPTEKE
ncbi:MAG TPA: HlyD family efflux transporter periplasmic adaptor subunit [Terracidiphilus sp.]|jgi:RND family efflux transporter MFP subunit